MPNIFRRITNAIDRTKNINVKGGEEFKAISRTASRAIGGVKEKVEAHQSKVRIKREAKELKRFTKAQKKKTQRALEKGEAEIKVYNRELTPEERAAYASYKQQKAADKAARRERIKVRLAKLGSNIAQTPAKVKQNEAKAFSIFGTGLANGNKPADIFKMKVNTKFSDQLLGFGGKRKKKNDLLGF